MIKITFNTPELSNTGEPLSECIVIINPYNIYQDIDSLRSFARIELFRSIENAVDRFSPIWIKGMPETIREMAAPLTAGQFANVEMDQVYNAVKNILSNGDSAGQWQEQWGSWDGFLGNDALNTLTVEMPTAPDVAPTTLTATAAIGVLQIDLTWSQTTSNEFGFTIERSETTATGFQELARIGYNETSYSDVDELNPDKEYFYRVAAWNWAGLSAYTNEASDTTDSMT